MAGRLDWGAVGPPSVAPANEIASIGGLLGAIAEGRARKQAMAEQAKRAEAIQRAQFEEQQRDNQRDMFRLQNEEAGRRRDDQRLDAKDAWDRQQAQQTRTGAALPGITAALDVDNFDGAQIAGAGAGVQVGRPTGHDNAADATMDLGGKMDAPWSRYTINAPGGQAQSYDPVAKREGLQRSQQAEAERMRARLGGVDALVPGVSEIGASMAAAGAAPGDVPQKALAIGVQLKNANRPRGGGGKAVRDENIKKDNARADEAGARQLAQTVLGNLSFKELHSGQRKYDDMVKGLGANNAALDAATAGSWTKLAQGGTGVISDSDMEAFWHKIGGTATKSWQWVRNVVDGKIEPGKRAIVLEAVNQLAGNARGHLSDLRSAMEHAFDTSQTFGSFKTQMVGTYFPSARKPKAAPGKIDVKSIASQIAGGK